MLPRIKRFVETVMSLILLIIILSVSSKASTYYIAGNGSDSNDGNINNPWKTFESSVTKLSAGDTLYLRAGVYYESSIDFQLSGTSSNPVVIIAYANEKVEISGGIPDFRDTSTNHWTLVDPAINLYKSVQAYGPQDYMNAWLLDDDLHLITYGETTDYDSWNNLTSTNYGPLNNFDPIFVGPGIMLHNDGHLHVRLENNPSDLVDYNNHPIDPIPSDINPNNHRMSVFFTETLVSVSHSAYIVFKNLTFSHARNLFDLESQTNNIEFDGCRFDYGRYAVVGRSGGAEDYTFQNCEFNNGLPQNVYWTDVKNRAVEVHEAYPEFQSGAFEGEIRGFNIHDNLFRDSFDAIFIDELTRDVKIINNDFIRLRDDAISLGLVSNVEIAHNLFWRVGAGVSCAFDNLYSSNNGHVYIHHNIIDFSAYQHGGREGNYREDHWPVWQIIHAFANHEQAYAAWWKVYNNTIIGAKSGYEWNPEGLPEELTGNSDLYVYNNIFFVKDDRIIFRYHQASSGAHYDGDVVFRLNPAEPGRFTLFYDFGNGNNYETLAEFRTNSGTNWEQNGLEQDPGFDLVAIENPNYQPGAMWNRYVPADSQIFTPGASYAGLNWPGTQNVNYRGAVPPDFPQNPPTLPDRFSLQQNYPNPFNPGTRINFSLSQSGFTTLKIYDVGGKEVVTLISEKLDAGPNTVSWDARTYASGIYFYQLKSGRSIETKKMILMR
jgi:hypothetical protein